jgi:SAM-dependent methyltransferase
MTSQMWDDRYAGKDAVWSTTPNMWVEQVASPLPAGTALDLAAGEGRNALWLAELGWTATAVDFSSVALERARAWASERLGDDAGRLTTIVADLEAYEPQERYDLVMVIYLQVPADLRRQVLRTAAAAVAPGGRLLVVAHDSANIGGGHGGPQDPAVCYTAEDVVADVAGLGLAPLRVELARRPVQTPDGEKVALDALAVLARD